MPETNTDIPTIVFVIGVGHSGTTLLEHLIGSHSRVFSVGPFSRLTDSRGMTAADRSCTCGAERLSDCETWRRIDAVLEQRGGPRLADLRLDSAEDAVFERHNLAVLRALREATGSGFVTDSSKSGERLVKLISGEAFDVRPIHIMRDPRGVVFSNVRKGRSWATHALRYTREIRKIRQVLAGRDHLTLSYEALANNPERVLGQVMDWLGLAFEPRQLDWARAEHHSTGGNRTRRSTDSTIQLDTSWQSGLTRMQRWSISCLTLPARW